MTKKLILILIVTKVSIELTGKRDGSLFSTSISLALSFKVPYDFVATSESLCSASQSYKKCIKFFKDVFREFVCLINV